MQNKHFSIIPSNIHAIWLGAPPQNEVLENLANWAAVNKGYQAYLWIDSATYDIDEKDSHLAELTAWAESNNVIIRDIALSPDLSDGAIEGKNDVYQSMLGQQFYNEELNGVHRNLAAASDILRLEILYREGGIYIDAKDVFPGNPLPAELEAQYGFFMHSLPDRGDNNDVLASIPQGSLITRYRNAVQENYQNLEENETKLKAHRNPDFRSPHLFAGGNPRQISTIQTSGPGIMGHMIMKLMEDSIVIPEAGVPIVREKFLHMDNDYLELPSHQALSWFNPNITYKELDPVLKNYVRHYFDTIIDEKSNFVQQLLKNEKSKWMLSRKKNKINLYTNLLKEFSQLKHRLHALPADTDIRAVHDFCIHGLKKKERDTLNKFGDNLFLRLKNCGESLDALIVHCKENDVDPLRFAQALMQSSTKYTNDTNWATFIKETLDTPDGRPNLDKLADFIQTIPEPAASHKI